MNVKGRSAQACGSTEAEVNAVGSDVSNTFFDNFSLGVASAFASNGELKVNYMNVGATVGSAEPPPAGSDPWRFIANQTRSGATFSVLDLSGSYVFSWVAGANNENARTFNLRFVESNGTLTGTAFFGFTSPMTGPNDTLDEGYSGIIDRMYCNWTGAGDRAVNGQVRSGINQGLERGRVNAAQKQVFVFSPSSRLWTPTANNLRYAPTNSCDFTPEMVAAGFGYHERRGSFTNTLGQTISDVYFGPFNPSLSPSAPFVNELFKGTSSVATTASALQSDITAAIGGSVPVL
jgi:hypothetical protein